MSGREGVAAIRAANIGLHVGQWSIEGAKLWWLHALLIVAFVLLWVSERRRYARP